MQLVIGFATTNKYKLIETQACLAQFLPNAQVVSLTPDEDVEETGATFEANARLKLDACLAQPQLLNNIDWVMAEDSGLVIPALTGLCSLDPFPGVLAHRWYALAMAQGLVPNVSEPIGYDAINAGLLNLMGGYTNRSAAYVASLAVANVKTKQITIFTGEMPLQVAHKSQGGNGFGYDPIMIAYQYDSTRTVAQLTPDEKNKISHRAGRLKQFAKLIEQSSVHT